jgi:membrane-associated PAP2 superfamily phosphatase
MSQSQSWWLRTKSGHMVLGTLSFAIPITLVFGIGMYRRGVLSFSRASLLFAIAVVFGALASLGFWNTWLKKRI